MTSAGLVLPEGIVQWSRTDGNEAEDRTVHGRLSGPRPRELRQPSLARRIRASQKPTTAVVMTATGTSAAMMVAGSYLRLP
jgi:hypothetical protein